MEAEILIGSPRKKGNSFLMSDHFLKMIPSEGNKCNLTFLYDFSIEPCIDCRGCKSGELECLLNDQMNEIYSKLESSDVIIFATPVYWYGPTAKTKLVIDRLRPYYVNRKLEGKKAALLLPASAGEKDCDLIIETFRRIFQTLDIKYIGVVTAKAFDTGEVIEDKIAMASIEKLAQTLLNE